MLAFRLAAFHQMTRPVLGSVSTFSQSSSNSPSITHKQSVAYSTITKKYASLPKLPVPSAETTLKHFLEFSAAIQSPKELEETRKIVSKFAANELPKLQELLEKRASRLSNWLTPWWLDIAYLAARSPLPIVTSPGILMPTLPYKGIEGQIEYAAKISQAATLFHQLIERDELPQDMAGKVPFDMSQYRYLFGTTRVPKEGCDEIIYGSSRQNKPRHAVVMRNGQIFRMDVLDKNYAPLSLAALKQQFAAIVENSKEKAEYPIGVVSSDGRDRWAATYRNLKKNRQNEENLNLIEEGLFVVCLDQGTDPLRGYSEKDEQARQVLHGGGVNNNSGNRWFDKTIQFVIGSNGLCGMTYEHTPAEGPPVAALMDYVCDQITNESFDKDVSGNIGDVEKLEFELTEEDKTRIKKSSSKINAVADDLDLVTYTFKRYGKNFPKSVKISPDSFIQMAFQLAYYRIHSCVGPTYETATLRKFDEGRTENIRSPNTLAAAFVKNMTSKRLSIPQLYESLKAAAESHKTYTVNSMNGNGLDRHLLAWKLLANENGLPTPSILQTSAYEHMAHFQISTSQVPTRHFLMMCFGPSAPDCYGICYNPQETELHFTISTFKSCGSTSSKRFAKELERALNDMNSVCSKALKEQSKL
ncbi:unnamed protein product [Auanema sp. JU1783]|nr:unnamed protein product [Auanema sp. JU1783]